MRSSQPGLRLRTTVLLDSVAECQTVSPGIQRFVFCGQRRELTSALIDVNLCITALLLSDRVSIAQTGFSQLRKRRVHRWTCSPGEDSAVSVLEDSYTAHPAFTSSIQVIDDGVVAQIQAFCFNHAARRRISTDVEPTRMALDAAASGCAQFRSIPPTPEPMI
ncbi:hypothetical protein FQR65_LT20524 [Abscondita terminalis]|nr:hypothetical protein FQR65_LT20524 [Abscondita terminalis]